MGPITRRNFLKQSALAGLALSTLNLPRTAWAAPDSDTILVTIMLSGGPDWRYLFVPPYAADAGTYGEAFWKNRAYTYEMSPTETDGLQNKWNQYLHVDHNGNQFGVHFDCGWLKQRFDLGQVAVISNVFASRNRDHAHSTLRLELGDLEAGANDGGKSGWGGRLAKACSTNVCSLSGSVRQFCYGPHPTNPLDHDNAIVIDGNDTRAMGLYEYDTDLGSNSWRWNTRGIMSRALTGYYAAKQQEVAPDSPFRKILQHEQSVRSFGRLVNTRLETVPIPQEISDLYTSGSGNTLSRSSFGRQIRNIYDTMACEDLLNTNVLSADYGGWDHHRYMQDRMEPAMGDLFGSGKSLDTLETQLEAHQPGKAERMVFLIYGEFGRQLAANGDYGTDHGEGNYAILIGSRINGGVYGDMFPAAEIPKFSQRGTDIEGLTAYTQVIGRICEHLKAGSGQDVVPGWDSAALEPGVDLTGLFA